MLLQIPNLKVKEIIYIQTLHGIEREKSNWLLPELEKTFTVQSYDLQDIDSFQKIFEGLDSFIDTPATDELNIIHIEAHGSKQGLIFPKQLKLAWSEIQLSLATIYQKSESRFLLCLSSCKGLTAGALIARPGHPPFGAIVGPSQNVLELSLFDAYNIFYSILGETGSIKDAASIVNQSMPKIGFKAYTLLELIYGMANQPMREVIEQYAQKDFQKELLKKLMGQELNETELEKIVRSGFIFKKAVDYCSKRIKGLLS